ncbi:BnaA10g07150D [Brassica napus]|nr:unnamed protein product [Brassica napus]CDY14340.1 BnaA10g07150D [Brassica napus]
MTDLPSTNYAVIAKTLPKIGDRHFDYRIYGNTIVSLTVSSSSALLKHSFETEGMVECNYDATSKITGGWILRGHLGVALRGKHDRL